MNYNCGTMQRREFLSLSTRALLALPVLSFTGKTAQSSASGSDRAWAKLLNDLESLLRREMHEKIVPGLSGAVVTNAKIVWQDGLGFKDSSAKTPVDADTIFEAASMSKPVFAYAVMKLCERGVMDLDKPLTHYTSQRFLEGDPRLDLITARHVLSHTTGFQNWRSKDDPLKIHFTPGTKFMYSGEGYNYLQSVMEHVTGQPVQEYMKSNLFEPFGMTSSGYVWNEMFERRMARPHDMQGKPMNNKKSMASDVARYGSSGALLTTPTDYAKFILEILKPKKQDEYRLSQRSIAEMLRPGIKASDKYPVWWALGWRIFRTDKGDLVNHGGDNEGFHCFAGMTLARKNALVLMTNGEGGAHLLSDELLRSDPINQILWS